jgi:hypothetical protein
VAYAAHAAGAATGGSSGGKMLLGQRHKHEWRMPNLPDKGRTREALRGRLSMVRGAEETAATANRPSLVFPVAAAIGGADQRHSRVRAREGGAIWGPRLSRAVLELFGLRLQCRCMGGEEKERGSGSAC